jgi:6-phosphogluconolactonase
MPSRYLRRFRLLLMVAASTAGALPAAAQPVYEQAPSHVSGLDSNTLLTTAEDFVLASDASVGRVEWWGGYSGDFAVGDDDAFTIEVRADAGGQPGAVVATYNVAGDAERTATGNWVTPPPVPPSLFPPARAEFYYSYDLPALLPLKGETRYWITIVNGLRWNAWVWEQATSAATPGVLQGGDDSWWRVPADVAFRLTATPPPPPPPGPLEEFPSFLYVLDATMSTLTGFSVDPAAGTTTEVSPPVRVTPAAVATAVAASGPFLYAPRDTPPAAVEAFVANAASGALQPMPGSPFPMTGARPYAATVAGAGRFLYVANFDSADIRAARIDQLSGALTLLPGQPFPWTVSELNSLAADPGGDFLYGASEYLHVWRIDGDTGALTSIPVTGGAPSARMVTVHPSSRFLYTIQHGSGAVSGYAIARDTGGLTSVRGTPPTVQWYPHTIAIDPTGRFVFVAGADTITTFLVDPRRGSLAVGPPPVSAEDSVGNVFVEPSGHVLFAEIRRVPGSYGAVAAFRIDPLSGALSRLPAADFGSFISPTAFAAFPKGAARNHPPYADAGPDVTVECASPAGTPVRLDGTGTKDLEGDEVSYEWREDDGTVVGSAAAVDVVLRKGQHVFTLTVADAEGLTASDTVVVTVRDTMPPTVDASMSPALLWPPDGRLVPVTASVTTADACDGSAMVSLVSITSTDPNTNDDDIQEATVGTDDRDFVLRAWRDGRSSRIYLIEYESRDTSGNVSRQSVTIEVPHDGR